MNDKYDLGYKEGYRDAKRKYKPKEIPIELCATWEDISSLSQWAAGGEPTVICSHCWDRNSIHVDGIEHGHWNYCPICGARMEDNETN